ncbi:MAG: 3-dehydroquinate synthase [Nitrososphaeria archaeon]|nr:3-dehydroquinate synthase [Nitrososphaeria archaeon]
MIIECRLGRIIVEREALNFLEREVDRIKPSKVCIVTDNVVGKIWLDNVIKYIKGRDVEKVEVKAGEGGKSLKTLSMLWRKFIDGGYTRKSLAIALGGGVVGDVTGFAASTFMRGIYFAQVPTTLLSQVDSSIGGKNGINFHGKNMIGTFYQPSFTLIDTKFIRTLPYEEFLNGMAEVIKYGVICDRRFFKYVEENVEAIKNREENVLNKIAEECVKMKVNIVLEDEREEGLRRILNFGHTFGHAIEKLSRYRIKHGFAVSIGMSMACGVAEKLTGFPEKTQVLDLLKRFDLPTNARIELDSMVEEMVKDKKAWYGKTVLIVPEEIGRVKVVEVAKEQLARILKEVMASA